MRSWPFLFDFLGPRSSLHLAMSLYYFTLSTTWFICISFTSSCSHSSSYVDARAHVLLSSPVLFSRLWWSSMLSVTRTVSSAYLILLTQVPITLMPLSTLRGAPWTCHLNKDSPVVEEERILAFLYYFFEIVLFHCFIWRQQFVSSKVLICGVVKRFFVVYKAHFH